jgi:hypothetical protein
MGAPPTTLGLVALALALAVLWAAGRPGARGAVTVLGCVAVGVAAAQDLLRPGIAQGHDLHVHSWAVYTLWSAVLDGDLWPRWNPYVGLGMPLLQLYSPLGYVACWPFQSLGLGPVGAMKGVALLAHVASAGSAWTATRWLGGSRAGAALATAAFALAPYHLLDLNVRLAWGELVALPLLPLLFAAVVRVAERPLGRSDGNTRAIAALAGLLGLLLLSHVLSVVLVAPVLLVLAMPALFGRPGAPAVGALLLAGGAAMALTAWFWLPFLAEQGATSLSAVAGDTPSAGAADGFEALQRVAWSGYGVRRAIGGDGVQGMPLYFGAVLAVLSVAALVLPGPRPGRVFAGIAIVLVLLGVHPFAAIIDHIPGWSRMQFAFRLWGPASAAAALGLGLTVPARPLLLALALGALAWDGSAWLGAPVRVPPTTELSAWNGAVPTSIGPLPDVPVLRVEDAMYPPGTYEHRVARTRGAFPEYLDPSLRALFGRTSRPPTRAVSEALGVGLRLPWGGPPTWLSPGPAVHQEVGAGWVGVDLPLERTPERLLLTSDGTAGRVRITDAWFPGWRVRIDGGPWLDAERSDGLLAASLPAGARDVEFAFSDWHPWDRAVGNVVSLAALATVLGAAVRLVVRRWAR